MQNAKRTIFIYIMLLYTNICYEQHPIPAILTLGMDEVHRLSVHEHISMGYFDSQCNAQKCHARNDRKARLLGGTSF